MKKHFFTLFTLLFFTYNISAQTITVNVKKEIAPINPLFWGTNFLYWVEDDKSLIDDNLVKLLKDIPCTVLRYPGGTVADNFYWKTATLDNPDMFPYESGPTESSFEEFMTFCQKVGAEPMLVVNTQSFYLKGKVDEGAEYAADWVKYCKDKGYKVSCWEIGNETYWHPVMSAREYGTLVVKYAEAMKRVDPNIIISVNGHWDKNLVGTKERTDKQFIAGFFESLKTAGQKEIAEKMKEGKQMLVEKNITKGDEKWWENVLDVCGNNIDMLSIHWYFHENKLADLEPKLSELKNFVTEKMNGKQYKWALTEYNCNTKNDEERVMGFAEGIGKFLNFGFDVANFWPMRIGGMQQRSMFSLNKIEPQYPYQIFKLFSKELAGNMVSCTSDNSVFAFASSSQNQITVVLSGSEIEKETSVTVNVADVDLNTKEIVATQYSGQPSEGKTVLLQNEPIKYNRSKVGFELAVLPKTFVVITIKNL